MHYPLAMLLPALMDQRAYKELEEPGTVQQNKTDREEEDRGLADGREEGWGGHMEGYGGHGSLSIASWTHLRGGRRGQSVGRSSGNKFEEQTNSEK